MKAARAAIAGFLLLAGCSGGTSTNSAADPAKAREEAAIAPLKAKYSPVIQGIDAGGTRLDVFVDNDQLLSMDETAEDQLKADLLSQWRAAWKAGHPGKHAKLTVRLRNYYGETVFTETTSA